MVGQDAVAHLCREDGRESVDLFDLFVDHLAADDDVADQLPLFRVVIAGEGGEFAHLADIMQQSDAHEEVALEERIALAVEVTELGNAQGVFAESADKTVVYGFRSRRQFKRFDELCIVHKKHLQKLFEVRVLDGIHKLQDRLVHVIDIPFGNRQIIGRVILPFVAESRAADIELQVSLEGDHLSGDIHVVHLSEFSDPHAVRIPDLGVDSSCLVLECQRLICLSRSRYKRLSFFTEIDILYATSVLQITDVSHFPFLFLSLLATVQIPGFQTPAGNG